MSSGRYHFGGWWVFGGGSGVGRMASVHEAWHDRLQFTTLYGLLVQHVWSVGAATDDAGWTARGDDLLLGAQRAHEEFASVMSEVMSGDAVGEVRREYPLYAGHADRARLRVGDADVYTLLHRVSAVYRTVMQPSGLIDVVAGDLSRVGAAGVPRTARPDFRLGVLTQALRASGWGEASRPGGPRSVGDFADEADGLWGPVSEETYERCRGLLEDEGCGTLPYEGQLGHVEGLNERAVAAAGRSLRLFAVGPDDVRESDVDVVLRAFESETLGFEPQPVVVTAPPTVSVTDMISGRGADGHLFVAVRPAVRSGLNATSSDAAGGAKGHVGVLRSSTRDDDGRVRVVVRAVDPDDLVGTGVPVLVSVSVRSLAEPVVRERWGALMSRGTATVLIDLPLTRHVRTWVVEGGLRVTYALGEYAARDRRAVALALLAHNEAGTSRLHLAVVTPSYAAAFEVWLAETPEVVGQVARDDGLLDRFEGVVSPTMGHLLTEEARFDFKAGE